MLGIEKKEKNRIKKVEIHNTFPRLTILSIDYSPIKLGTCGITGVGNSNILKRILKRIEPLQLQTIKHYDAFL